ncbi:MAG: glycosyltransferase family 4 protein [Pseudomonadota bacterium]|nr:glycosyltransferase family 4 protein [Pseudomonadota bacterium]
MSAAIFYHPEAFDVGGPKVMGRNAAGASFLKGFAAHSRAGDIWTLVDKRAHAESFARELRGLGRNDPVHVVDRNNLNALKHPGVVHYPSPRLGPRALQRAAFGHHAWSLCGITHTVCSAGAMDSLTDLLVAPIQPWDALMCTSTAVKDAVTRLLDAQADYLRARLGATRIVLPQLPVIPLGINTADFTVTPERRAAARATLGVDDTAIVVLFLGRLSFHAKAHPLPQYLALENAARATGRKIVLVECGWHASPQIADAFREAAQLACPSVRVVHVDSTAQPQQRPMAWAAADIFSSLSDNLQESFGITPLEGMAAGLPLVVSDWNGYRDTVRDGIDGFRVPTLMPQAGLGADLALAQALEIDSYDTYCGNTSQLIAVDVDATAAAFIRLIDDPQLRAKMGAAGRERVRRHYDWAAVMPRYEALWEELRELRKAQASAPLAHPWPARLEPFHHFARYPTHTLTPNTQLQFAAGIDANTALARAIELRGLRMIEFAKRILPTDAELGVVLAVAKDSPVIAGELVRGIAPARRPIVLRALAWLVKIGILRVCD